MGLKQPFFYTCIYSWWKNPTISDNPSFNCLPQTATLKEFVPWESKMNSNYSDDSLLPSWNYR